MSKEEIIKNLKAEGFTVVNEYADPPGEFFPDHDHPGDQKLVIIKGSMTVVMDGKNIEAEAGETIFFPARLTHSAKMGPDGCHYIDGERPA
jgi:quercetin dioxygenase-like cupin family protein